MPRTISRTMSVKSATQPSTLDVHPKALSQVTAGSGARGRGAFRSFGERAPGFRVLPQQCVQIERHVILGELPGYRRRTFEERLSRRGLHLFVGDHAVLVRDA